MKRIIFWICLTFAVTGNAVADDMHDNKTGTSYKTEVLAKSSNSWDGSPLPEYPMGTPEIAVVKITIAPGAQLSMHKHPSINAGMLLSGELTVINEANEIKHLKAGEALIELVNKWHYGKNEGSVPAEILVVYAGTADQPLSVPRK